MSVAHAPSLCIWHKQKYTEMYALEIATQLVFTPKKMIAHASGVIPLAHSATGQTMMSVLIVTMDLSV